MRIGQNFMCGYFAGAGAAGTGGASGIDGAVCVCCCFTPSMIELFFAVVNSILCVIVEVLLNLAGALVWEYP